MYCDVLCVARNPTDERKRQWTAARLRHQAFVGDRRAGNGEAMDRAIRGGSENLSVARRRYRRRLLKRDRRIAAIELKRRDLPRRRINLAQRAGVIGDVDDAALISRNRRPRPESSISTNPVGNRAASWCTNERCRLRRRRADPTNRRRPDLPRHVGAVENEQIVTGTGHDLSRSRELGRAADSVVDPCSLRSSAPGVPTQALPSPVDGFSLKIALRPQSETHSEPWWRTSPQIVPRSPLGTPSSVTVPFESRFTYCPSAMTDFRQQL